jgi:hypothetical protein
MNNLDLYIDGQPLTLPENSDFRNFADFCSTCSTHLEATGRAIQSVHMDGVEVDCSNPPSVYRLMMAKRVEVNSCLLAELVLTALQSQRESARTLADKILDLSTDCLIELPQETFEKWHSALETLKPLIGFIPHFYSIQGMSGGVIGDGLESALMGRIQTIQEAVDEARSAMDKQDIVQFSDILELQIVPWLKEHADACQKIAEIFSKK